MPFCTACGHQNPDDARFCAQCGTALEPVRGAALRRASRDARRDDRDHHVRRAGQGGRAPRGARPERRRRRRRRRAARRQRAPGGAARPVGRQPLPPRHRRGRGRSAPRQRDLPRRRHRLASPCRVPPRARGLPVADVGSLNGTYVNRDRIDEVALQGGDEVQIGKYRLVYFASHAGSRQPAVSEHRRPSARARISIGEVLERLRPDFPGLQHLQDPLPGVRGPGRAGAHAGRLPQVLRRTTSSGCATSSPPSASTTCR